jgi:hypothetical protein
VEDERAIAEYDGLRKRTRGWGKESHEGVIRRTDFQGDQRENGSLEARIVVIFGTDASLDGISRIRHF